MQKFENRRALVDESLHRRASCARHRYQRTDTDTDTDNEETRLVALVNGFAANRRSSWIGAAFRRSSS